MTQKYGEAVSPVVGVMLMLVFTIIIAAIVSAFAGGAVSGQQKTPQATIQGTFSVTNGLQIIHADGDPLPLSEVRFVIRNDDTFGPGAVQISANIINLNNLTGSNGNPIGTSFNAGQTLYLNTTDSACSTLQNQQSISRPDLCLQNATNVGKSFTLEVEDLNGKMISQNSVEISP